MVPVGLMPEREIFLFILYSPKYPVGCMPVWLVGHLLTIPSVQYRRL
jgi:hypothetical protein